MSGVPRISVVVATYNQATYLSAALESLFAQDIDQSVFEAIVVDDGSTDDTREILHRYAIRSVVLTQAHEGLVGACNRGLSYARGEYFARMDSDDLVARAWLRRVMETLDRNPEACCVYTDRYERTLDGRRWRVVVPENNLYALVAAGTMMRTEDIRVAGGFRPLYWEEYDLYLRLQQRGAFIHLPEPLYIGLKHADSMSANADHRRDGWRELLATWGSKKLLAAGFNQELHDVIDDLHARDYGGEARLP